MAVANVAIVNSGGANTASLLVALNRLGADCEVTSEPGIIRNASHVILPGVGSAADAMTRLRERNLIDLLPSLSQPTLGICLGLQLLAEASEEDDCDCLGIVPGVARRLEPGPGSQVPNIGWTRVYHTGSHPILRGIDDGCYFYFLHSYALAIARTTIGSASHQVDFTAILARENFVATQFHPERSSQVGAQLLSNFLDMQ